MRSRIWLLWQPGVFSITPVDIQAQRIHVKVQHILTKEAFQLTVVYGYNQLHARQSLWEDLKRIADSMLEPWLVIGDFNNVLSVEDRRGGQPVLAHEFQAFNECIDQCMLSQMRWIGDHFTWCNRQTNDNRIWSRIDWALINNSWMAAYPTLYVETLQEHLSDHRPLWIRFDRDMAQRNREFRFSNMWMAHPDYLQIVATEWRRRIKGTQMYGVVQKLRALQRPLQALHRSHYGDIVGQVDLLRKELLNVQHSLQMDPINADLQETERELRDRLLIKSKAAYALMIQQSKAHWLREGDDNSAYFHGILKKRTYQTRIVAITNEEGRVETRKQEVIHHFLHYYEKLLGTTFVRKGRVREEVIQQGNVLRLRQQIDLIRPFTAEDVRAAVHAIHSSKSPGYDGYNSGFFKSSWDVIGPEVCNAVLNFFSNW